MTIYVDAGYFSYFWGSQQPFGDWLGSVDPEFLRNAVFLMDSDSGHVRQAEFSEYKVGRLIRRQNDPERAASAERVREFRKGLRMESWGIRSRSLPGYEADDLVAMLVPEVVEANDMIVGIDKDFAQCVNGLPFYDAHLIPTDPTLRFISKLPRYARGPLEARSSDRWFAIYQALTGDKSDSIPRLMPSRSINHCRSILREVLLYGDLDILGHHGRQVFYQNLRLVTLPHPSLLPGNPEGAHLYQLLLDGDHFEALVRELVVPSEVVL